MAMPKQKNENVLVSSILLDSKNPRIPQLSSSAQSAIRNELFERHDVMSLVKEIAKSGYDPTQGELIVTYEGGKLVVVEGNRRICALQCLLDPKKAPQQYRDLVSIKSDGWSKRVDKVPAKIMTREAAEPIITRIHTKPAVRKWPPVANHRRVRHLLEAGLTVEEVAVRLSLRPDKVRKLAREESLIAEIRLRQALPPELVNKILSGEAKTNPFTRFMQMEPAKQLLGLDWDESVNLSSSLSPSVYQAGLKAIAAGYFAGKSRFTTRTETETVLRAAREAMGLEGSIAAPSSQAESFRSGGVKTVTPSGAMLSGVDEASPSVSGIPAPSKRSETAAATNGGAGPQVERTKKISKVRGDTWFQNMTVNLSLPHAQPVKAVVMELTKIDHRAFPTAATSLLRIAMEATLWYCIINYGLEPEMRQNSKSDNLGLEKLIQAVKAKADKVFVDKRLAEQLDRWKGIKFNLDAIMHGKNAIATPVELDSHAAAVRPALEQILSGKALNKP